MKAYRVARVVTEAGRYWEEIEKLEGIVTDLLTLQNNGYIAGPIALEIQDCRAGLGNPGAQIVGNQRNTCCLS